MKPRILLWCYRILTFPAALVAILYYFLLAGWFDGKAFVALTIESWLDDEDLPS